MNWGVGVRGMGLALALAAASSCKGDSPPGAIGLDVRVSALTQASIMLLRGSQKLLYYFGYPDRGVDELVKLYDIEADPEELNDLYPSQQDVGAELLAEVKSKLVEVNKPYL